MREVNKQGRLVAANVELAVLRQKVVNAQLLKAHTQAAENYLMALTLPVSMTHPTSSMVMDVSATLVATTILRTSAGTFSNTLTCQSTMHVANITILLAGKHQSTRRCRFAG